MALLRLHPVFKTEVLITSVPGDNSCNYKKRKMMNNLGIKPSISVDLIDKESNIQGWW